MLLFPLGRNLVHYFPPRVGVFPICYEGKWLQTVWKWLGWLLFSHSVVSTLGDPVWAFQGKNTGVGCHFLLQRIFPTQGSNLSLLHWQAILYRRGWEKSCFCLFLGNNTSHLSHLSCRTSLWNARCVKWKRTSLWKLLTTKTLLAACRMRFRTWRKRWPVTCVNTKTCWMSRWRSTSRSPPTGSCWKERRAGREQGSREWAPSCPAPGSELLAALGWVLCPSFSTHHAFHLQTLPSR